MGSSRPKYASRPIGTFARSLSAGRSLTVCGQRAGFTLVEVVASLLIVGILGAIAGMGLVTGLRGYMQAKENGHLAQKAQIAMARIKRELMEITDVIDGADGTDPWVLFDNPMGRQALRKHGNILQLGSQEPTKVDLDGVVWDTLIDQIDQEDQEKNFRIAYRSGSGDWDIGNDIDLLSTIDVTFVLRREEGRAGKEGTVPFNTTVSLRNTKNTGGAAAMTDDDYTRAASRYNCFIESAGGGILPATSLPAKRAFLTVFLLWLFWITSFTDCRRLRRRQRNTPAGSSSAHNQSGHVLVALVVTLLLFAALGAGMVSLIGTSATSQVTGDTANRAYYLAESGFRYAASRYLNATDANGICKSQDEKSQTLADLHDILFTLAGNDGKFRLKIFPYFLTVTGTPTLGSTTLATHFSGAKPEGFALPPTGTNARVKIGDTVYSYTSYNEDTGQLSLSEPLADFDCAKAVVKLIGFPGSSATLTKDGNLTLSDGDFFPKTQGRIKIDGVAYGYATRTGDVLQNIIAVDNPEENINKSINSTTEVVLEPFVTIRSTGIVGQGDMAAAREVVYNVPIPERPNTLFKEIFYDPFDDDANWAGPFLGDFDVQSFEGDSALAVTGTQSGVDSPKAALLPFNWSTKRINFASAHKSAGRFLSYDAQVKILFDLLSDSGTWEDGNELGTAPDGLPKYFMAGIAFRLEENLNTYGLSLTRGSSSTPPVPDNISPGLMPQDQTPMLVLWQNRIGDTPAANWLAYGVLPQSIIFSDDMESGENDWTQTMAAGNEWSLIEYAADSPLHNSGTHSWTTSPGGAYGDGEDLYLESKEIDLSGFGSALLTFWTRYQINTCNDNGFVEICPVDTGTNCDSDTDWIRLNDKAPNQCPDGSGISVPNASSHASYTGSSIALTGNREGWVKKTLDISDYIGNSNTKIRFHFNRNNGDANGQGWWIDDVRITTKEFLVFPENKATVMVRVFEAAVIRFTAAGTVEIEAGDLVSQPDGGAIGVVVVPPVLEPGTNWPSGNAKGMLWLNKTSSDEFRSGTLDVLGKGTNIAAVTPFKQRTNLIKAYYNTLLKTGEPGTSYDNPYDPWRLASPRGQLRWPADEGEPTVNEVYNKNDYFTLIEWDIDINFNVPDPVERLMDEEGKYTIIATDSLLTPSDTFFPTALVRPEIGLQAFGHGAIDLYFDDFGMQVYFISGTGFLQPIQQ
ncbi:MAG: prepilin-type N-terminal cleavage/methylation domain-containing protein [Desulfobacterales bacterium]